MKWMNSWQMIVLTAVLASFTLVACLFESDDLPGDCAEACKIAKLCAEENETLFSQHECEKNCRIQWQKIEFADCQEDYKKARDCMKEELDDDEWCDTSDDDYTDAIEECEDDFEDYNDCMEDYHGNNSGPADGDDPDGDDPDGDDPDGDDPDGDNPANTAACRKYCDKAVECTPSTPDGYLQQCYDACDISSGSAVPAEVAACANEPTCDSFFTCLQNSGTM